MSTWGQSSQGRFSGSSFGCTLFCPKGLHSRKHSASQVTHSKILCKLPGRFQLEESPGSRPLFCRPCGAPRLPSVPAALRTEDRPASQGGPPKWREGGESCYQAFFFLPGRGRKGFLQGTHAGHSRNEAPPSSPATT